MIVLCGVDSTDLSPQQDAHDTHVTHVTHDTHDGRDTHDTRDTYTPISPHMLRQGDTFFGQVARKGTCMRSSPKTRFLWHIALYQIVTRFAI